MELSDIKGITLHRAEGRAGECREVLGLTLKQADLQIASWGSTAPHIGNGYHKVDVTVYFKDETIFKNRFDMTYENSHIYAMSQFLEWCFRHRKGTYVED